MNPYVGPELLTDSHRIGEFDCGDDVLNRWLTRRASRNQREGSSRTWVVTDGQRVVAFYASSAAVLARSLATKRAARNQPDPLIALPRVPLPDGPAAFQNDAVDAHRVAAEEAHQIEDVRSKNHQVKPAAAVVLLSKAMQLAYLSDRSVLNHLLRRLNERMRSVLVRYRDLDAVSLAGVQHRVRLLQRL